MRRLYLGFWLGKDGDQEHIMYWPGETDLPALPNYSIRGDLREDLTRFETPVPTDYLGSSRLQR